jgi:acetate kinase
MSDHVVTLNAGSSSVKFALFAIEAGAPRAVASGQVEGLGAAPQMEARSGAGETLASRVLSGSEAPQDHAAALRLVFGWIEQAYPHAVVAAIGHRVVHGGAHYAEPVVIDDAIIEDLTRLSRLAPLHQPHNLAGIAAARREFTGVPQVACFDTAFHRGHAFVHDAFALPRALYEEGIRRYGFHGLSYEYIVRRLREVAPAHAAGRLIVAHLGNGASMCAIKNGRSVACTMGFSTLDGLAMGTRCGQLDPAIVLYLFEEKKMSAKAVSDLLYKHSGLKGLSGLSNDMRALEEANTRDAREAIEYFVSRIRHETGALAAALEGVDAMVFTAGIGEHAWRIRESVLTGLAWLGIELDRDANRRHAQVITSPESRVRVFVLATNEEAMIAQHTIEAAGARAARGGTARDELTHGVEPAY